MKWYKGLYASDSISHKKRKILHKLKRNKFQFNVYAIVLPLGDSGILEIYPAYVFLQEIYKKQDVFIVGLASDRDEAYKLVDNIVMDCYKDTGQFDIKKYIEERQGCLSW